LQKSTLVAMKSVRKRGSVGLLHEFGQQFQADPTLPRFGTDFIATRFLDFCKTLSSLSLPQGPYKSRQNDKLKFIGHNYFVIRVIQNSSRSV